MINPAFLKTFTSLAETKSFTKTAKVLHMTQPGVSQHLKWLEEYFETPLINRVGKRFELTEAGEKLVEYGRSLFVEHERFKAMVGVDNPHQGVCRYASTASFGLHLYSFLLDINHRFEEIAIHFSVSETEKIVSDLLRDLIDVGFVTKKKEDPNLLYEVIDEEKLLLIVPHSFKSSDLKELKELGFIDYPDGNHNASRLFTENFSKDFNGMDEFAKKCFLNQINQVLAPVSKGVGFTVVPHFAYEAFQDRSQVSVIDLKSEVIDPVYKVRKKYRLLPKRFQFIDEQFETFKNQRTKH